MAIWECLKAELSPKRVSLVAFLPLLLMCGMLTGCGRRNEGPARFGAHGSVQLDGQPLSAGRILFVPQEPTKGPAASAVITNGTYEIPVHQGLIIGKHRVEIEATIDLGFPIDDDEAFAAAAEASGTGRLPPNPVPPQYNRQSRLSVEVASDGEQTFDFQLHSEKEESR